MGRKPCSNMEGVTVHKTRAFVADRARLNQKAISASGIKKMGEKTYQIGTYKNLN